MKNLVLGTYAVEKNHKNYINECISNGYKYIDTAQEYKNFEIIGNAIKKLNYPKINIINKIEAKNWWRNDLFDMIKRELDTLNVESFFSILIHWPPVEMEKFDKELELLTIMKNTGLTKNIGLSNCPIYLIERAKKKNIDIDQLQVEYHPYINQKKLIDYCALNNIKFYGHSLTAQGKIFKDPILNQLSTKYDTNIIDVVLNFCLMQNIVPIIASQNVEQAKKNISFNSFHIELDDIQKIIYLNMQNNRYIKQLTNNPKWDEVN